MKTKVLQIKYHDKEILNKNCKVIVKALDIHLIMDNPQLLMDLVDILLLILLELLRMDLKEKLKKHKLKNNLHLPLLKISKFTSFYKKS